MIENSFMIKNTIPSEQCLVRYEQIHECPNCKKALAPEKLFGIVHTKNSNQKYLSVADFCNGCNTLIVSEYEILPKDNVKKFGQQVYEMVKLLHSAPISFKERKFDEKLENLSPQFVKIYNQAKKAEELELDEIAGLGYRKSLEFLIKDYAIYNNPLEEIKIKETWMSQCINNYISDEKIKTLAEKSEWIGNDEAHYIKIQDDRDINDMKVFIDGMIYFIQYNLVVEDAKTIQSKKSNTNDNIDKLPITPND